MADALYPKVAAGFTSVLSGVGAEQWTLPTPCTDWDVRGLVVHVIETHRRVRSIVLPDLERPPVEGADLPGLWRVATADILDAVSQPALASHEVQGRSGPQTFEGTVNGLLTIDTLCHTWDLARATGQSEDLDPEAVAMAHAALIRFDQAMRVPGGFAEAIESEPDADDQTRFLNFAGRLV